MTKRTAEEIKTELVHMKMSGLPPADYGCRCRFCSTGFKGVLVRKDGTPYSRLDRNRYYSPVERIKPGEEEKSKGHVSKTPLHAARWAIQTFTKPGDWVMDPTMGAGTTAVEALNHNRNAFGVEIQYIDVIEANVAANNPHGRKFCIIHGDARELSRHLAENVPGVLFDLIVNNPPYSGDERAQMNEKLGKDPKDAEGRSMKVYTVGYDRQFDNLAFQKEGPKYWEDLQAIYAAAAASLRVGGRFVIGVKDQVRGGKSDQLHRQMAEVLERIGLAFEGVVLLPHHPRTFFMNLHRKNHPDADTPLYQSIIVFRKPE